ncbi:uncharacterized protein LOC114715386 [Neltuma alba]|uniref:uncharacterized protein LOC114715386 n=1 Tax=Neltuma alba TaxID=207710 RepID=UPI0010A3BD86|nr:uncharacterized protein LOC114715386 [Prosopis alba]
MQNKFQDNRVNSEHTRTLVQHQGASSSKNDNGMAELIQCMKEMKSEIANNNSLTNSRMSALEQKIEQWETKSANLNNFVTQMSNTLNDLQARSGGSLPSNTVINPKSLNAISLRSGRQVGKQVSFTLDEDDEQLKESDNMQQNDDSVVTPQVQSESKCERKLLSTRKKEKESISTHDDDANSQHSGIKELEQEVPKAVPTPSGQQNEELPEIQKQLRKGKSEVKILELPFPKSFLLSRKLSNEQVEKDALNLFSKLEVNVPLLDFLKSMPKYVRFSKELCTNKRKCKPNKLVQIGSSVSALFKPHLPVKCSDPGSFTIPCTIGKLNIASALLDLGAAINVMPLSIYTSLGINSIKDTSMIIQLVDRSIRRPHGLLEDILVKVKDLIFPADFYVLDMSHESTIDLRETIPLNCQHSD